MDRQPSARARGGTALRDGYRRRRAHWAARRQRRSDAEIVNRVWQRVGCSDPRRGRTR